MYLPDLTFSFIHFQDFPSFSCKKLPVLHLFQSSVLTHFLVPVFKLIPFFFHLLSFPLQILQQIRTVYSMHLCMSSSSLYLLNGKVKLLDLLFLSIYPIVVKKGLFQISANTLWSVIRWNFLSCKSLSNLFIPNRTANIPLLLIVYLFSVCVNIFESH